MVLWPNDRKAVRQHLEKAARLACLNPGESALSRLAAANKLALMCSPDITIGLQNAGYNLSGIQGRDQLRETIIAARAMIGRLDIRLYDYQIQIAPNRLQAEVLVTAIVEVDNETNAQPLRFILNRETDGWRIARVESIAPL